MQGKEQRHGPQLSEEVVHWLAGGGPFPETLTVMLPAPDGRPPSQITYQILDRDSLGRVVVKHGYKGFVLKVQDQSTGEHLAAKICIPSDYTVGHSPLAEAELAGRIRIYGEVFHLPRHVGRVDKFLGQPSGDGRPWVCFISQWLEGSTLEELIKSDFETITPGLVVRIAETLIKAVLMLESKGLKHDDLHAGNLMLVKTSDDILLLDPQEATHSLKIIDLGSLKDSKTTTFKDDDDWSMVAKCLSTLHGLLFKDRVIASRYAQFLRRFKSYIKTLAEEELARFFPTPQSYLEQIREIANSLTLVASGQPAFHPFDAISAEHLANDQLLLDLFVDHLPWILLVQTAEPTVLIGPRGCGKSMVFRHMGIKTHLSAENPKSILEKLGFFGVYLGCASDLGNDLIWIAREPGRPQRWASSITTYFNLVLARELMRSLAASSRNKEIAVILGLSEQAKIEIAEYLQKQIPFGQDLIRLKGMDPLQTCADRIDQLRLQLSNELVAERKPAFQLPPTFIRDLCQHIVIKAPGLDACRIVFLLDDYTAHRLSPSVQSVLNTVLWQRNKSHTFKISSEPHGFDPVHMDNAIIDANREYAVVDAGQLTIAAENEGARVSFITRLINKRLEAAGFKGSAADLIGESEFSSDIGLAKEIRLKRPGRRSHYHGIQVISNAWSGDVATILHMLREIFARGGVVKTTQSRIPPLVQHDSIVKVSNALRARVTGYHPLGEEMAKVLNSYGELCRRLLIESPAKIDRSRTEVVHRRYRLEMTLPPGLDIVAALQAHSGGVAAIALMKELVRRAIFIELPESRGKEDSTSRTLRWQIRSSFLPGFGTSLVRDSYLDVKGIDDFVDFLLKPEIFAESYYLRLSAPDKKSSTYDLFSDLSQGEEK